MLDQFSCLFFFFFFPICWYSMLQDKPYNKDDDVIKATSFEVISTLRDVLKTSSLWRDHVQTYTQVCFVFKILGELLEAFFVPMIVTSNFY